MTCAVVVPENLLTVASCSKHAICVTIIFGVKSTSRAEEAEESNKGEHNAVARCVLPNVVTLLKVVDMCEQFTILRLI